MDGLGLIAIGVLILILTPIVVADLGERRIPPVWTLVLGLVGLAYDLVRQPGWTELAFVAGQAAVALAVLILLFAILPRLGRWGRLGGGDAWFLLAACSWVGLEGAVAVLVLAGVLLGAVTLFERARGASRWSQARPFAPMLATGLVMVAIAVEFSR